MLPFFRKKQVPFFTEEEKTSIGKAIQLAETTTSGEIRVYAESHCNNKSVIDRAAEMFHALKMEATAERNGVLVYIAIKDKKLAVYADEGIYTKVGKAFWDDAVQSMLTHFKKANYATGVATVVKEIGEALATHFPYDAATDKNELPDDIVFGK